MLSPLAKAEPTGRTTQVLMAVVISLELILSASLLAIFASAYPDTYRSSLWREGGTKGWNSHPSYRVYLWANYKEVPSMPLVWDEKSTLYNLCAAIITPVFWFVRLCIRGRTLDLFGSLVSNLLYDAMLVALWCYSVVVQSSGDFSDPAHIALRPWYLDRACSEAWPRNQNRCLVAKGSFYVAFFTVFWFGLRGVVTCMYGAYVYGKRSVHAGYACFDEEKACESQFSNGA